MSIAYHALESFQAPLALKDMGSFFAGGRVLEISGQPVSEIDVNKRSGRKVTINPNGEYHVEHMYVQYYIPQRELGSCPLLLWHGGGMTGATYESTPDGRPGWLQYFLRCGWHTCLCDSVERGRSGWAPVDPIFAEEPPTLVPMHYMYERYRLGASYRERSNFENSRFPMESFSQFSMEFVPRWTGSTEAIIAAYCALLERTGPAVILGHSQGASLAFQVAQSRPELVKALVAVEPYATGDRDQVEKFRRIPVLWVLGDHMERHPAWKESREKAYQFHQTLVDAGCPSRMLELPEVGILGNSHMLMMERNNYEIADLIQGWLVEEGLCSPLE